MTMEQVIKTAGEHMGYFTLKDEQLRIAADVLGGRDGFVYLPTGYGKSLCYVCVCVCVCVCVRVCMCVCV